MRMCRVLLSVLLFSPIAGTISSTSSAFAEETPGSQLYTNARFEFSVRYPQDWRLGDPMPDGMGVTLYPPVESSQVALSGFMNVIEGKSQDGRQTLDEFTAAHRRIITELHAKRKRTVTWEKEQATTLAGFPAKQLSFTYQDDKKTTVLEMHIFSLGRNEGRGVRIKLPAASKGALLPAVKQFLASFQAGRDQNAVSPFTPATVTPPSPPSSPAR